MPLRACISWEREPPWRDPGERFEQLIDDANDDWPQVEDGDESNASEPATMPGYDCELPY